MIKYWFLTISALTLFLNILLTYYLIREKTLRQTGYIKHREIVSFDLSQGVSIGEEATAALDTEVIASGIIEEQVI